MDRDYDGRLSFGEFMGEETPLEKVNVISVGLTSVFISISIKNGHILPTGQWYAPSAVIKHAWYCMVMHGIAWYCMVLHGTAWYCLVLHGIALYCMVLHGIA